MNERFMSRNESFGKTIFDKKTFQYDFMTDEEYLEFANGNQIRESKNKKPKNNKILHAPIKVYFDLTSACNLRCRSCHNDSAFANDDELTTEEAIKTVEGISKDGVFYIKFSGGELTQRGDWHEIVESACESGLTVGLNTNGVYDSKTLEKLITLPIDEIDISVDGDKKTHDSIRGHNTYEKAVSSIKALSEAGKRVTVNSLITSQTTEGSIESLLEFGDKYCESVDFFHIRPIGRAKKNPYLNISFERLGQFYIKIRQLKRQYPKFSHNVVAPKDRFGLVEGGTDGFVTFNILPNGDLFAGGCVKYVDTEKSKSHKLGNIVSEGFSLLNVWHNSERLWELRERYRLLQKKCNLCNNYKGVCEGFTVEMDLYYELHKEKPFCKFNYVGRYNEWRTNTGFMFRG